MKTMKYLLLLLVLCSCSIAEIEDYSSPAYSFSIEKQSDGTHIYYQSEIPSEWEIYVGLTIEDVENPTDSNPYLGIFKGHSTGCGSQKISVWWAQYFRLVNSAGVDEIRDIHNNIQ